jgi:hypothetical protein
MVFTDGFSHVSFSFTKLLPRRTELLAQSHRVLLNTTIIETL